MITEWYKWDELENDVIQTVTKYVRGEDGTELDNTDIRNIQKLIKANPLMMNIICSAFFEDGYNSF